MQRNKIQFLILILSIIIFQSCKNETLKSETKKTNSKITSLRGLLKNTSSKNVMVISHRGDWRNAPENSLQAIQNCIDMGVDMVEVDVRSTKDGVLVLMHDEKIDRTTTGKGYVSDWSLDSLETLYLRNGVNHPTHHKIPTLKEAMRIAKGKILVNLDKCYDNFDKAYEILKETGTIDHVIIKGNVTLDQVQTDFGQFLDKVYFMPVINLNDKEAEKTIEGYIKDFKPIAFEFVFDNEESPYIEKFREIRNKGSRVWVNSLWESLNAGYEDDMAVLNQDSIYGWYLEKGVNMIQTDRPELLLNYLRKNGLHN